MSYYILNKGFELCGWQKLPFALRYPEPELVDFFDREQYAVLLRCDGKCDIDKSGLSEIQMGLLERLLDAGIVLTSDGTAELEPWQEYKSYPCMFKKHVQWSITGRCNYRCKHCFMSAPDGKFGEPSLDECMHIISELDACGIKSVGLTGGEPMVNAHMSDILRELSRRRISVGTIYSNGFLVIAKLLDELEELGQHPVFQISFDGVGHHDWLRGIEGAEAEALRAFKLLQERGFHTTSAMCLHKHNIGAVRETVQLLASLGCSSMKINVASPTGEWAGMTEHFISADDANAALMEYIPQYFEDGAPMDIQLGGMFKLTRSDKRFTIPFARFYNSERSKSLPSCGAVKTGAYISPDGLVLPCMTMAGTAIEKCFDSIFERPLSEILSDSEYSRISCVKMGEIIAHNEKCRDCRYAKICGAGCRAIACGETGTDYFGIDDEACAFFLGGWYEKIIGFMEEYDLSHGTNYTGKNSKKGDN